MIYWLKIQDFLAIRAFSKNGTVQIDTKTFQINKYVSRQRSHRHKLYHWNQRS